MKSIINKEKNKQTKSKIAKLSKSLTKEMNNRKINFDT